MATILLGPIASDVRGSTGGTTFSRNKGGAYMRARVTPVNPFTSKQSVVRANFAVNSKAWSGTLTADQRAAWSFFAQNNSLINRVGQTIIISGNAMYNSLNQVLKQIGVAPISDPPTDLSVPALAAVLSYDVDSAGPATQILTAAQSVVAGAKYYIYATGPLAPGRTPQTNQFRFIGAYAAIAAAVFVDFTDAWQATFGTILAGKNYGVRVASVNTASGALTAPLTFSIIGT